MVFFLDVKNKKRKKKEIDLTSRKINRSKNRILLTPFESI